MLNKLKEACNNMCNTAVKEYSLLVCQYWKVRSTPTACFWLHRCLHLKRVPGSFSCCLLYTFMYSFIETPVAHNLSSISKLAYSVPKTENFWVRLANFKNQKIREF